MQSALKNPMMLAQTSTPDCHTLYQSLYLMFRPRLYRVSMNIDSSSITCLDLGFEGTQLHASCHRPMHMSLLSSGGAVQDKGPVTIQTAQGGGQFRAAGPGALGGPPGQRGQPYPGHLWGPATEHAAVSSLWPLLCVSHPLHTSDCASAAVPSSPGLQP